MKPYYDEGGITIYHGDAVDLLLDFSCLSDLDLAILDPPYNVGIRYDQFADDSDAVAYWRWIDRVLLGCTVAPSVCYFPGKVNLEESYRALRDSNWEPNRLLAWHKREFAGDIWTGGPAMCWEPIHWAVHGDPPYHFNRVFGHAGRDFLIVPSTHGKGLDHPCPKPPEVMRWLVGMFLPPAGRLIDPCMGVGTSLLAAKSYGGCAVGIEQSERYCEIAANRLGQEVFAFSGSRASAEQPTGDEA